MNYAIEIIKNNIEYVVKDIEDSKKAHMEAMEDCYKMQCHIEKKTKTLSELRQLLELTELGHEKAVEEGINVAMLSYLQ